jgi:ketosteroid isomerase-like protein
MNSTHTPITLRRATAADEPWIARLAALDSSDVPEGVLLVAERDDEIVAAVAEDSLEAIADPFRRTADVVALLRRHAIVRRNAVPARRHFRLVPRAA